MFINMPFFSHIVMIVYEISNEEIFNLVIRWEFDSDIEIVILNHMSHEGSFCLVFVGIFVCTIATVIISHS